MGGNIKRSKKDQSESVVCSAMVCVTLSHRAGHLSSPIYDRKVITASVPNHTSPFPHELQFILYQTILSNATLPQDPVLVTLSSYKHGHRCRSSSRWPSTYSSSHLDSLNETQHACHHALHQHHQARQVRHCQSSTTDPRLSRMVPSLNQPAHISCCK